MSDEQTMQMDLSHLPTVPPLYPHLTLVEDLFYFDGPLLAHHTHDNGDHYLYYWCDYDQVQKQSRCMFLRIDPADILRIKSNELRLDHAIPGSCLDNFVWMQDDADTTRHVLIADLDPEYQPGAVFLGTVEGSEDGTSATV